MTTWGPNTSSTCHRHLQYDRLASSGDRINQKGNSCGPERDHPRFPQPDPITAEDSEV